MNLQALGLMTLLLTGGTAVAQFPLQGFLFNWDRPQGGDGLSYVTRFGANAEEHLNRIDFDDYRQWGVNAAGQIQVQGFMVWIQDMNDQTVETFSVVGYPEQGTGTNLPNLANRVLNAGPFQMPPTGTPPGAVAYELYTTFAQPATFPATGDVFVGTSVAALRSGPPTYDGLWTGAVTNDNTNPSQLPTFDVPGPRGRQSQLGGSIANDTYVCYVSAGTPNYLPSTPTSLEQLAFDVHVSGGGAGGVALTTTNQTSYVSSNAPLGTSNFLSGLHPDITRGDNIGFAVTAHNTQVPAGSFAFILMAFGPFAGGPLPITTVFPPAAPGSAGNVCIDFTQAATFSTVLLGGNPNSLPNMVEGQLIVPLSAAVRAAIGRLPAPVDLWWQGIVLDASGGGVELRTTGCAIQHLR